MKKILLVLLVISVMLSLIVTTAIAEGSQASNPSTVQQGMQSTTQTGTQQGARTTTQADAQSGAQQGQMNQYQNRFEENKLDAEQLRTQTRAQLDEQYQLTYEYKAQLRIMNQTYCNMSEQERAANAENIENLMQQVREAQRYTLQISFATQKQARNLYTCVEQNGIPAEEEVEEVIDMINEL